MSNDIIIIRGGSGTGKTTLAASLRPHFPNGITIESDRVREMFNRLDWMCKESYTTVLEALAQIVSFYATKNNRPLIVVDTFETVYLKYFCSRLPSDLQTVVISLYADCYSVWARMRAREGDALLEKAVLNSITQGQEQPLTGGDALAIDTTNLSSIAVCKTVLAFLANRIS
ncbi:gluconokinase [Methylococcales bacterium]|nr:gluconokinase [Methylococcales bacterium]